MTERYEIDAVHSSVTFAVKHMMVATVRGSFGRFAGYVETDAGNPAGRAELVIQADSIATGVDQRDQHLRSSDFLDSDRYPQIRFTGTAIEARGEDSYLVRGDLTIRDVTRPFQLQVQVEGRLANDGRGNQRVAMSARGELNRKDFGLTMNIPMDGGGVVVGEVVKFEVDLSFIQQLAVVPAG